MSEREKQIAENLAEAVAKLPDGKREFLLGYAEGVAAMADKAKEAQEGRAREADTNDRKED